MEGIEKIISMAQELVKEIEAQGYDLSTGKDSGQKTFDFCFYDSGSIQACGGIQYENEKYTFGLDLQKYGDSEIADKTSRKKSLEEVR
jgi:hypothetical protein